MDNQTQIVIDELDGGPLTADELSSVLIERSTIDPRYIGLNRAQRRKAQSAERKAFKNGRL